MLLGNEDPAKPATLSDRHSPTYDANDDLIAQGVQLWAGVVRRELGGAARLDFRSEGLRATLSAGVDALAIDPEAEAPGASVDDSQALRLRAENRRM